MSPGFCPLSLLGQNKSGVDIVVSLLFHTIVIAIL